MEYAIRQDESNWPMVKADRELVLSQDPKKWNDEIQAYIEKTIRKDGDMQIRTLEGETLTINEKSQWHAGSRVGYDREGKYKVKVNASAHLDEVAQVAIDQNRVKVTGLTTESTVHLHRMAGGTTMQSLKITTESGIC